MQNWIKKEPKGLDWIWFMFLFLIVHFIAAIAGLWILNRIGLDLPKQDFGMSLLSFTAMLPLVVLTEEICFRLPLMVPLQAKKHKGILTLVVAIGLSAIFGYLHGNIYNCFIQGVGGLIFCLTYVKCGGWNGRFTKALFSSYSLHLTFDLIIVAILLARGVKNV
jgi:hypothetical protein